MMCASCCALQVAARLRELSFKWTSKWTSEAAEDESGLAAVRALAGGGLAKLRRLELNNVRVCLPLLAELLGSLAQLQELQLQAAYLGTLGAAVTDLLEGRGRSMEAQQLVEELQVLSSRARL